MPILMSDRADLFVDNFKQWVEQIVKNYPKDLRRWVFVYCRDAKSWTDEIPEWDIKYVFLWDHLAYDRYTMKQLMEENL